MKIALVKWLQLEWFLFANGNQRWQSGCKNLQMKIAFLDSFSSRGNVKFEMKKNGQRKIMEMMKTHTHRARRK